MSSAAHVYRKAEDRARALEAFPGPEPMSVLLVEGPAYSCRGIATQPIDAVDVIILEMLGGEAIAFPYRFFGPFIHGTKSWWYP